MKRNFTKILAALALLVFMMPSLVAWGQQNYVVEFASTTTGNDGTAAISSLADIVSSGANYITSISDANKVYKGKQGYGVKLGSSSAVGSFVMNLSDAGKVEATSIVFNSCKYGSDDSSLKITINGSLTQTFALTADLTDYTYTFNNATEITSIKIEGVTKRIYVKSMTVNYGGTPTTTCATPTFNPAAGTYSQAQTVSISCTTEGATIYYTLDDTDPTTSSSVYSTPLTISQTTTVKAIAVKDGFDDSSIASATYTIAQSVSGYTIDFEQPASLYTDWTFTTITSEVAGTTDVPAHGGSHYGSTDGKTTGTIVTKTAIATPNTLTCYLSKASGNTTSSTWYVEVSSNGSDWTQAGTHSATSMNKGEWVEFTTNLSNYSNVYVRIRYAGTTAVRCIDDVVLSTEAPAIATPVISPESGTFETTQEVTITCATEGATIYYTTNGDDPTNLSSEYTGAFTLTETATVKAIAYNGAVYSTIASATYTKLVINNIEDITSADSYTVKGKIFAKSNRGFVLGDGTGYVYVYKTTSNNVGDYVKVTGTVTDQYNGIYEFPSSSTITSVDAFDIAAATPTEMTGDAITTFVNYEGAILSSYVQYEGVLSISTSGNNTYYNLTIEGTDVQGSISYPTQDLTNFDGKAVRVTGYYVGKSGSTTTYFNTMLESITGTEPSITVTPETLNLESGVSGGFLTVTYENLSDEPSIDVIFVDAAGQELETPYDWVNYTMEGTSIEIQVQANEGAARTAYLAVTGYDSNDILVQSNTVTINQAAYVAPITSGTGTITFGYGNVVINAASVTGTDNLNNTWTITTEGTTSFTNNNGSGFAQVGSSSKPATSITFTTTLPAEATISAFEAKFGGFSGTAGTITLMVGETTVGTGSLVETNDVTVSTLPMVTGTVLTVTVTDIAKGVKCYYISYTLGTETYTLDITGYTDVTEGNNNKGYYLIASPVTVDPATVEGMTTGDFDLYYYDQAGDGEGNEWINYEPNVFNLVPGTGYLYAKKATAETQSYSFNLTGAPYTGTGEIPVAAGWNLIGNPFGVEAEISSDYYALTYESNELIATTAATHVAAMQGVFVNADEDDTVIFEAVENNTPGKGQNIALNLSKATRGASTIDRAIVRFDEGQQLPKFQLFENSTKLYIAQGNKDYAIVRSAAQGEMPVSFRASENGTYTLSIETENVEMNYLHLIDNMTGADVDLLATPNYTFEARTNDYTSRFRLVFSAEENGASTGSATFAYFNGTSWTVSNTGDATLQVVDITGRIVSSETITGNATVSLNQPAGIYMLRLVNGNDVKVQKVVVR